MTFSNISKSNYQVDVKHQSILVVDDNSTNLSVIVDCLEELDFTTLTSKDGESAIRRAKYVKPDIILLDILMPGIDGYETCRRLKVDPITKDIPIIFMTALSSTEDKVKGFEVGAVDYVTKPIQPQEVVARINLHLKLRCMSSTLTEQNQLLQREVKQRKEIEQKLLAFNEQLETKVAQRTSEVSKALQEKELLLKEIHHRVKNNLLVVAGILDFQTNYIEDPKIVKMLEHNQDRITSMAMIHEQLYSFDDLKRLNLADYIAELVEKLSTSYNISDQEIEFLIDTEDIILNIETIHPCGLIINELIANSLEHAFPSKNKKKGTIKLDLKYGAEDKIVLSVIDNGIGFPDNFNPQESESLGLQLVYTLVEQLDGKLEIDGNNGTSYRITFDELQYKERIGA